MSDVPNGSAPVQTPAPGDSTPNATITSSSSSPSGNEAAKLQALATDPNAPQAVKKEAAKMLKSLKLKIDGREVDEKLPFEIPDTAEAREYMARNLQLSKASQKRMGEKAALEQEVGQFLEQLKKNPRAILADPRFGVDVKKLAAEVIEEEIANASKSPDQLKREELERELQKIRSERKQEQEEFQKQEFTRLQQVEYERYDNLMTAALDKSDLPKSPYVIKKMADYMLLGLNEGMNISPDDVLPLVREEILEDIRQMAQSMPIETLEKLFGGDVLSKIRKKNVAKAKGGPAIPVKAGIKDVGAAKTEAKPKEEARMSYKKFFGV